MAKVEIYTSMLCGYCHAAKALLKQKGIDFNEFDVLMKPSQKREMIDRAGGRTSVPQIFIDDAHIGGYDDIAVLDAQGELDPILGLA
jgi:glutaredoxin 3